MPLRTVQDIQFSVHSPNLYLQNYWRQLLPDWATPVHSVLVVLQRCQCSLLERTEESETTKNQLRDRFLSIGRKLAPELWLSGYQVDFFDPRTGLPFLSSAGSLVLDDVAVVHATLGYALLHQGNCSVILHPQWGSAVYPSTLVSSAPLPVLEHLLLQDSIL